MMVATQLISDRLANMDQRIFFQQWQRVVEQRRQEHATTQVWMADWLKVFRDWPSAALGPAPIWIPDDDARHCSNLARWMSDLGFAEFGEFHRWSVTHRTEFWQQAIARLGIVFEHPPTEMMDVRSGPQLAQWLPGARLNIAASCFQGPGERDAVLFGRADGAIERWTLSELERRVKQIAASIRSFGFPSGAPLAVVLPMTADAVAIYLGIVWSGCTVVSIADSFAVSEIGNRLRIAGARGVFTYDEQWRGGKRLTLYERVRAATELPLVVLPYGDQCSVQITARDQHWNDFLDAGRGGDESLHLADVDDAINILFSSGTTGDPKAIPWSHSTPIRSAVDGFCHQDIRSGQVCAWPTNLGWMMGPWLIFASLINRGTIAVFEDAPTTAGFGRFVQDARVNMLGVVPTIVKAWRASGLMEPFDWSAIHLFSSTGESSQRDDMVYLSALAHNRPIIEYCGGTEIGGGYITSTVVQPNVPSAFSTPAVGLDFVILDESQQRADEGELFIVPPSIGLSSRLLNRDHFETYYAETPAGSSLPPLRRHGDHFRRLPGPCYVAGGRVDDTMNLGGIKISSAELERVLNQVAGIRETAAVAVSVSGGPEELVVFAVAESPLDEQQTMAEMNRLLKEKLNPLFRARQVVIVDALPRTASNKVMRRLLRDQLLSREPERFL